MIARFSLLATLSLSFAPIAAIAVPAQPASGPNGNGTLDHQDDLRWLAFAETTLKADYARGVYEATFGGAVKRMNGATVRIGGYMLPVETASRSAHFVLTRRSTGCPFCPPNEPTEAIEVFAVAPAVYTQAPVTVEGSLELVGETSSGLFYRLNRARVTS